MSEKIFQIALDLCFASEGGLVDDPRDDGGRTNMGITQATLDYYRRNFDATFPKIVDELKREHSAMIYKDMFWIPTKCDHMPNAIAIAAFDYAVNSGPGKAIKRLQQALFIPDDGVFGLWTEEALKKCHVPTVLDRYMAIRCQRWATSSDYEAFGLGWFTRGARLQRDIGRMMGNGTI